MQHLQPNTLLQGGKYKIERVLGQGGFGITYLAEQVMLGRKVAVKEFFMKELCDRDETTSHVTLGTSGSRDTVNRFRDKFLKEARMIACMSNSHIVPIYDIFEENGTAYYIMENIDGGSLDSIIKEQPLQEAQALKYIREIADALQYIHNQNILHLDIKPSNILLRKNGEAVLIDFGISKRYDDQGGQTSTTPAGISKGYAPTEQYNQGIANFSPATDIYSLGATLYKMLTGTTPPEASLLLNEDEELIRPNSVSFATWCAIEKAMEPRRKKRPQSVGDFLELLGNAQGINDITNETDTVSEETSFIEINKHEYSEETIATSKEMQIVQDDENGNKIFTVNGVSFKMIKVQAGSFVMGNKHTFSLFHNDNAHNVTLTKDYYIGETQVTQELWQSVMGENPSHFQSADNPEETKNHPVEMINRVDCQSFFEKLREQTGYEFRFPTEAEWEFAAKGGNHNKKRDYQKAWDDENSDGMTHRVKQLKSNVLGLYDMLGNVYEWCSDAYMDYDDIMQSTDPEVINESIAYFIIRGGSFCTQSNEISVSTRKFTGKTRTDFIGIRLALTL